MESAAPAGETGTMPTLEEVRAGALQYRLSTAAVAAIMSAGPRLLVMMRGAPGSGKSSRVADVVALRGGTRNCTVLRSADDSFAGVSFDKYHNNVNLTFLRAEKLMRDSAHTIIVDDTNYLPATLLRYAEAAGAKYQMVVVYPSAPWANNTEMCLELSPHKKYLTQDQVKKMVDTVKSTNFLFNSTDVRVWAAPQKKK